MYIKIHKYYPDEQCWSEDFHECQQVALRAVLPEPPKTEVKEMMFLLDSGLQTERTIFVPCNNESVQTEIYYMNNQGKTIERYQY